MKQRIYKMTKESDSKVSPRMKKHSSVFDLTLVLDKGANDSHFRLLKILQPTLHVWVIPGCPICDLVVTFFRSAAEVSLQVYQGNVRTMAPPPPASQARSAEYPRVEYHQEPVRKKSTGTGASNSHIHTVPLPQMHDGAPPATLLRRLKASFFRKRTMLREHQNDLLRAFRPAPGFMQERHTPAFTVFWEMGSGKTLGAVALLLYQQSTQNMVVCNNTNVGYWVKHIISTVPPQPVQPQERDVVLSFEVAGYTAFRTAFDEPSSLRHYTCVVLDEAHYFRNSTQGMKSAVTAIHQAKNVLLLTGTPLVNAADDVVGMLQLIDMDQKRNWEKDFPTAESGVRRSLPSPELVTTFLRNHVSWFDPRVHRPRMYQKFYPQLEDKIVKVPMTFPQTIEYLMAARAVVHFGPYPVHQGRSNRYNCLTRAVCNAPSGQPLQSPKLHQVLHYLRKHVGEGPQLVHSSLVDTGVVPLKSLCQKEGLAAPTKMDLITGATPNEKREQTRQRFNKGKLDVMFISDASQFGMDLAGTRAIHLVEPHLNKQNENQTTARAVRMGSHTKSDYKTVKRYKYISTFPNPREMTEADLHACRQYMIDHHILGTQTAKLLAGLNLRAILAEKIAEEGYKTINEKQEEENVRKHLGLEPYLEAFRKASVPMTTQQDAAPLEEEDNGNDADDERDMDSRPAPRPLSSPKKQHPLKNEKSLMKPLKSSKSMHEVRKRKLSSTGVEKQTKTHKADTTKTRKEKSR